MSVSRKCEYFSSLPSSQFPSAQAWLGDASQRVPPSGIPVTAASPARHFLRALFFSDIQAWLQIGW